MRKNKVILFADNNLKYYQMYYYYLSNEQKFIVPMYIDLIIFSIICYLYLDFRMLCFNCMALKFLIAYGINYLLIFESHLTGESHLYLFYVNSIKL